MKKLNILTIILIAFILPLNAVTAQDIIEAKDLAKIMKNDNVVIVSTRTLSDYKKVHIAGAVHVDLKELYKSGPVDAMIKSPAELARVLGGKGIGDGKTIVIYDDGTGKYSGRLYWILDYLGADDVKILNGHMDAWRAARKPVTRNPSSVKAVTFTPKPDKSKIATQNEVVSAMGTGNAVIVDVRSNSEFKGTDEGAIRKGHIPGAINLEFVNVLDAKGKLKSADQLKSTFERAGITKDKQVILYCRSSVRAGIVYMALKSALDYPNVKVYDGAFLEWQSVASNKVEM